MIERQEKIKDIIQNNNLKGLKKGDEVISIHFGADMPIKCELLETPRNFVTLVMLKDADKYGLFNEHGSIHTKQLKGVKND